MPHTCEIIVDNVFRDIATPLCAVCFPGALKDESGLLFSFTRMYSIIPVWNQSNKLIIFNLETFVLSVCGGQTSADGPMRRVMGRPTEGQVHSKSANKEAVGVHVSSAVRRYCSRWPKTRLHYVFCLSTHDDDESVSEGHSSVAVASQRPTAELVTWYRANRNRK